MQGIEVYAGINKATPKIKVYQAEEVKQEKEREMVEAVKIAFKL